jgi:DNA-binding CsgD family transcriptional regulator
MINNRKTRKLTVRQIETLRLIAEGYTSGQMSAAMSISKKTVEKHRQGVMDKLDIHNVALLTRHAVASGLVKANWTRTIDLQTKRRPRLREKSAPGHRWQEGDANGFRIVEQQQLLD